MKAWLGFGAGANAAGAALFFWQAVHILSPAYFFAGVAQLVSALLLIMVTE